MAVSVLFPISVPIMLLLLSGLIYRLLRHRNVRIQRRVILALMLVNVLQHLLKSWIYPHYYGAGVTLHSTAYNMCAVLILLSPLALLAHSRFVKNFVYFMGTAAGFGAVTYHIWILDMPISNWEHFRFILCHTLLFITSSMPLVLRHHSPTRREYWQVGVGFLTALGIILLNNVLFITMGLLPGEGAADLYSQLVKCNPCMLMGPKDGFQWIVGAFETLSPKIFTGCNPTGRYVPILWYALPVYAGISVLTYLMFAFLELQTQKNDAANSENKSEKL